MSRKVRQQAGRRRTPAGLSRKEQAQVDWVQRRLTFGSAVAFSTLQAIMRDPTCDAGTRLGAANSWLSTVAAFTRMVEDLHCRLEQLEHPHPREAAVGFHHHGDGWDLDDPVAARRRRRAKR